MAHSPYNRQFAVISACSEIFAVNFARETQIKIFSAGDKNEMVLLNLLKLEPASLNKRVRFLAICDICE